MLIPDCEDGSVYLNSIELCAPTAQGAFVDFETDSEDYVSIEYFQPAGESTGVLLSLAEDGTLTVGGNRVDGLSVNCFGAFALAPGEEEPPEEENPEEENPEEENPEETPETPEEPAEPETPADPETPTDPEGSADPDPAEET